MSSLFQVLVDGTLEPGADKAQVYQNIKKLFNIGEKQLAVLFSGEKVAIKRNLEEAAARKYQAALKRAGLMCYVEEAAQPKSAPPPPKPSATRPVNTSPADQKAPVDEALNNSVPPPAKVDSDKPPSTAKKKISFRIAPLGARVSPLSKAPPPAPDVAHISLAEQAPFPEKEEATYDLPDIEGLSLDKPGARLGQEKRFEELEIDLNHLELGAVGALMDQSKKASPPSPPDISHLSVQKE